MLRQTKSGKEVASQLEQNNPYQAPTPVLSSHRRIRLRLNHPNTLLSLATFATFLSMCPIVFTTVVGVLFTLSGLPHIPEHYHMYLFAMFVLCGTLGISISCFTFCKGVSKRKNRRYRPLVIMAPAAILAGSFHVWMGAFVLPFLD